MLRVRQQQQQRAGLGVRISRMVGRSTCAWVVSWPGEVGGI
jgi:hypothetical protein